MSIVRRLAAPHVGSAPQECPVSATSAAEQPATGRPRELLDVMATAGGQPRKALALLGIEDAHHAVHAPRCQQAARAARAERTGVDRGGPARPERVLIHQFEHASALADVVYAHCAV